MIVIDPPQVMRYAPATRPIAFVGVQLQRDECGRRIHLMFFCLDADKERIHIDAKGIPSTVVTEEQLAAFVAMPSAAGDTLDQDICRRALPIVQANLGLTGMVAP
jgi:hypothetical protein